MGVIRPSDSPWCSNPIVVPKPDGTSRFCTNFRPLNAITRKDKYPLERMDTLIDKLAGSVWYSSIDLKSAYWQIPIHETINARPPSVQEQVYMNIMYWLLGCLMLLALSHDS